MKSKKNFFAGSLKVKQTMHKDEQISEVKTPTFQDFDSIQPEKAAAKRLVFGQVGREKSLSLHPKKLHKLN